MTNRRLKLSLLPFVLGLACITKEVPDDASGVDAGVDATKVDAPAESDGRPKLPPPIHKELGAACSGAGDCASGFCVDGVCCDAACEAAQRYREQLRARAEQEAKVLAALTGWPIDDIRRRIGALPAGPGPDSRRWWQKLFAE